MKWTKWFWVLAIGSALILGAAGCGSSDDADGLEGTWKATAYNGVPLPAGTSATVTLSGNGTYTGFITEGGITITETGTWSATDTVLTTILDGEVENVTYTLSGNTLILSDPDGVITMTRQ